MLARLAQSPGSASESLRAWAANWGDFASIVGVVLSFVGFVATLVAVYRSKSAAEGARQAAEKTRALLIREDILGALVAAIANLEEIRRLHRASAWGMLPDRYAALRERLIVVRTMSRTMDDDHTAILREAENELSAIERRVERALSKGTIPPNPAKFNEVLSSRLNGLQEVLMRLRQRSEVEQ